MGQYSGIYTARQQLQAVAANTWPTPVFEYLIVAGGGGGGSHVGGGGGAGGLLANTVSIVAGTTYTITVGGAGTGGPSNARGGSGGNSSISFSGNTITAFGGGGGGTWSGQGTPQGIAGGSGGGSSGTEGSTTSTGGAGTTGQGYAGGNVGSRDGQTNSSGAGGGGAGAAATSRPFAYTDGNYPGGIGVQSSILGTSYYFAGGGGPGTYNAVVGGNGGAGGGGGGASTASTGGTGGGSALNSGANGGAGSASTGGAGGTNTGGGGGGGAGGGAGTGGNGGSGIVVIRTSETAVRTSGSPTVTTVNGLNVYRFNGSGSITFGGSTLGTQSNPASSVAALRAAGITTDGDYYFTMGGNTFRSYVRFNYIDGGDWYLILKVHNQGDMPSGSAYWQNSTLYNENDFNLTSGTWSKYASWLYVPFTRVMMGMTQGGSIKVPPIMIWNAQKTSFYNVISGITVSNGSGDRCDSTSPSISTNATYWNMSMASGTAFTDAGGQEDIVQHYGIGCFNNNASNSTTAEGFASVGRAGAWVGCPLDEQGHTFNNVGNSGSDSGFGFGASAGNPAKTTSCGYNEWTNSSSTNTLPAYLWVR